MINETDDWTPPPPALVAEFEVFLDQDVSLYGEIWRMGKKGMSDEDIRKARGASTPNFIWNYRRYTKALLEGHLPKSPTMLRETGVLFRRILRTTNASPEATAFLSSGLLEIENRMNNPTLQAIEEKEVLSTSVNLEKRNTPGIYVYSLMHYLRYPYDAISGRTLMKVGRSDRDVIQRFREQTRTTALPEEPVLLRIYRGKNTDGELSVIEKKFHALLEAADHARSAARTGGTEWFLTSLKFLDEIADTLSMSATINEEIGSGFQ